MSKFIIALAAGMLVSIGSAAAAPQKLEAKGQLRFSSDAPLEKIFGTAPGAGALTIDFADLTQTRGTITVPVKEMKTGNDMRDSHLRSDQWLDEAKFPTITYVIETAKVVEQTAKGDVKIAKLETTGKFTLHGVTTALTIPVTIKSKGAKTKITTTFIVKLADYQIKGKDGVVGKKVGESIDIKGSLKGVAQ